MYLHVYTRAIHIHLHKQIIYINARKILHTEKHVDVLVHKYLYVYVHGARKRTSVNRYVYA